MELSTLQVKTDLRLSFIDPRQMLPQIHMRRAGSVSPTTLAGR